MKAWKKRLDEEWEALLKQGLSIEVLCHIIGTREDLEERAAKQLLKQMKKAETTNKELCEIVGWGKRKSLRKRAAKQLLKREPTDSDLREIIYCVPSLKRKAQKLLKWRGKSI